MSFFSGIRVYGKAIQILFSPSFRYFLVFPVVIVILLFIGGNLLVTYAGDNLSDLAETKITDWIAGISWLQWVDNATGILIHIILRILYFFLFVAFGGYMVLIVMSPVYSWLSERTEAHLTGRKYPFSLRQFSREIFRGILIALRNLFFQLLLSFLLFLCSFIPVIGIVSPFAIFFTSAYFYGFSFIDYAIERKYFSVSKSVRYVNKSMGLVMGIGTVFTLSLMIPWLSIIACCFVSLLSVIAATIAVDEVEKKRQITL